MKSLTIQIKHTCKYIHIFTYIYISAYTFTISQIYIYIHHLYTYIYNIYIMTQSSWTRAWLRGKLCSAPSEASFFGSSHWAVPEISDPADPAAGDGWFCHWYPLVMTNKKLLKMAQSIYSWFSHEQWWFSSSQC